MKYDILNTDTTNPVSNKSKDKKSVSFDVLDKTLEPLIDHFNRNSNKKRILAILSPT